MVILNHCKARGCGYQQRGKTYGDTDWKEKIKSLVSGQSHIIVKSKNTYAEFNIHGYGFRRVETEEFLKKLDRIKTLGFGEDIYLYDASENEEAIWSGQELITEQCRYIFISHTATECQML